MVWFLKRKSFSQPYSLPLSGKKLCTFLISFLSHSSKWALEIYHYYSDSAPHPLPLLLNIALQLFSLFYLTALSLILSPVPPHLPPTDSFPLPGTLHPNLCLTLSWKPLPLASVGPNNLAQAGDAEVQTFSSLVYRRD